MEECRIPKIMKYKQEAMSPDKESTKYIVKNKELKELKLLKCKFWIFLVSLKRNFPCQAQERRALIALIQNSSSAWPRDREKIPLERGHCRWTEADLMEGG